MTALMRPGSDSSSMAAALMDPPPPMECPTIAMAEVLASSTPPASVGGGEGERGQNTAREERRRRLTACKVLGVSCQLANVLGGVDLFAPREKVRVVALRELVCHEDHVAPA